MCGGQSVVLSACLCLIPSRLFYLILVLRRMSRDKATGVAQRTHGTTDPGGVWHPVHRRECLTILLGTYAENGNPIDRRRPALYSVQPALPAEWQPPTLSARCGTEFLGQALVEFQVEIHAQQSVQHRLGIVVPPCPAIHH